MKTLIYEVRIEAPDNCDVRDIEEIRRTFERELRELNACVYYRGSETTTPGAKDGNGPRTESGG